MKLKLTLCAHMLEIYVQYVWDAKNAIYDSMDWESGTEP